MTIQQLRYVIVICDEGSLNKASEQLYIAQPSLTSALQELEKELGITIFNRSGRGVTPTNDGLEFIRYAREVVSQYDNLLEKYGKGGNLEKEVRHLHPTLFLCGQELCRNGEALRHRRI